MINENVLRENDIRGKYGDGINEKLAYYVGCAFGTYLLNKNISECIVGYDNRTSGEKLVEYLLKGLLNTGINIKFLGLVTTPILNYATINQNIEAGIIVTASHNPAHDNGFKLFGKNFLHLEHEELEKVYDLIKTNNFITGKGKIEQLDIINDYINMLSTYINKGEKKLKVAIDTGNGTTSLFIEKIIEKFNIEPIYLNIKSDGTFPNHNPDPNVEENLKDLIDTVKKEKCDLGVAYDGDGDRVGIVDEVGNIIETDKLIAIFSRHIMPYTDNKKVLIDVKCSKALIEDINNLNAESIMVKNGSAYIETEMFKRNILIGGEYSGHIFFRDRYFGYDDGIYASLRLFEILSNSTIKCSDLLLNYKKYYNTPEIRIKTTDIKKWEIIDKVKKYAEEKKYNYLTLDGARVEFEDSWALIRCSNTEPSITMRFEATSENRLEELKKEFINLVNTLL